MCGGIQIEGFIPEGEAVRCVARGTGADSKGLVRARSIERIFSASSTPWRIVETALYSQTQSRCWGPDAKRPKGLSFAVPREKLPKHAFREQYTPE